MSPQFQNQLTRLIKGNPYNVDDVRAAIEAVRGGNELAKQTIWSYYYPQALQQSYDRFGRDEEEANQAAFELMEHLLGEKPAILGFDPDKGKISTWYDRIAENFFTNYYNRVLLRKPDILYGHEQEQEMEEDYGDGEDLSHVTTASASSFVADYPYDGIELEDPESLALKKEQDDDTTSRIVEIRALLYPGDQAVYDLLLENYNSDEIASILERTTVAVENALRRIREAVSTVNG